MPTRANTGDIGGGVWVQNGVFTTGGTCVIKDNTNNNFYLDNSTITISETTPPKAGMNVGVTTTNPDGIIVQSGAVPGHENYFFADVAGKNVVHDNGQLKIV